MFAVSSLSISLDLLLKELEVDSAQENGKMMMMSHLVGSGMMVGHDQASARCNPKHTKAKEEQIKIKETTENISTKIEQKLAKM